MITPLKFNQPIVVKTERGDLPGLMVGLDETGTLARVVIRTQQAPQWFQDAHTSNCPQLFVSLADVEAG